MADKAQVAVELEPGPPVHALIDEDSLLQVLTNLVVNALHAMPDGGALRVAIAVVSAAPPESATAPTPHVRIDIADTGGGIPVEVKARMFEPFFTTKPTGEGTGLGLAVVYGIVTDHRGWIDVATSPRGTTFSIHVPEVP